jgi:hypothetical protein
MVEQVGRVAQDRDHRSSTPLSAARRCKEASASGLGSTTVT